MTRYLTCAETAKLIRADLKKQFSGIKFTVRSKTYSGGASIRIGWDDGPTDEAVRAVTDQYSGADFDGMVDYKFYKYHWMMPDGTVLPAFSEGSAGTGGYKEGYEYSKPHPEAEEVSMGADFIFTERAVSSCYKQEALDKLMNSLDVPEDTTLENYYNVRVGGEFLSTLVYRELNQVDLTNRA